MTQHRHDHAPIRNRAHRQEVAAKPAGWIARIGAALKSDELQTVRMNPDERLNGAVPGLEAPKYSETMKPKQTGDSRHISRLTKAVIESPSGHGLAYGDRQVKSGFKKAIAQTEDGSRSVTQLIISGMTVTAVVVEDEVVSAVVLPTGPYRDKPMGGQYDTPHTLVGSASIDRPVMRSRVGSSVRGLKDETLDPTAYDLTLDIENGITVTDLAHTGGNFVVDADSFNPDPNIGIGRDGIKQAYRFVEYLADNQDSWNPGLTGQVMNG